MIHDNVIREYDRVRTLVARDGFPAGSTGVVVSFYESGPACEVEMWDEMSRPVDVVTFRLDEVERLTLFRSIQVASLKTNSVRIS